MELPASSLFFSSQLASFQQGQVVLLCEEVEGRGKREELEAQVL